MKTFQDWMKFISDVSSEEKDLLIDMLAKTVESKEDLSELCKTIPEKKDYVLKKVFDQDRPFDKVLSKIVEEITSSEGLMKLCETIPDKKDYVLKKVFDQDRPFDKVLAKIVEEITSAKGLMTLCKTISDKKDYFLKKVFAQDRPFDKVLLSIVKAINNAEDLMELYDYYPDGRDNLLKIALSENSVILPSLLNTVTDYEENASHRVFILQAAAALGRVDAIKVMVKDNEQQLQSLFSLPDGYERVYNLAAKNEHLEVLKYLENTFTNNFQEIIKSGGLYDIFHAVVCNKKFLCVQHLLQVPAICLYAELYCNGVDSSPGITGHWFDKTNTSRERMQTELLTFYDALLKDKNLSIDTGAASNKQIPDLQTINMKCITALKKHLFTIVPEENQRSWCAENIIYRELFPLLAKYQSGSIDLIQLKDDSTKIFDKRRTISGEAAAITTATWLGEKVWDSLRAFFHACDALQAIFTGGMIDKPGRQKFFSEPQRQQLTKAIQNISEEFNEQLTAMEEEIKGLDNQSNTSTI